MSEMVKAKEPRTLKEVIGQAEKEFSVVSKDDAIAWRREARFALQHLEKNDFLSKIAWSHRKSLQNAIVNVSAIGISLNPAFSHAYLVPRKGVVCLDISYKGLIHLALSTGSLVWVQAQIVRENDTYENTGMDSKPNHIYDAFNLESRGNIVGAYCTVKTKDGDYLTEEMAIEDIWKIRDRSEAYKSGKPCPWTTDTEQMIKKTVVKRASSYWPKIERFNEAVKILNESGEGIDFEEERQDKRTRRGRNPNLLPEKLRAVFYNAQEAFDAEDVETVRDIFFSFDDIEEELAVGKCFNSKERKILKSYISVQDDPELQERKNNTPKITHLTPEERERLVDYNWNGASSALPDAVIK